MKIASLFLGTALGIVGFISANGTASANVYDVTYTVAGVGAVDLILTTEDTPTTTGAYGGLGYQVTDVTGTRDGVAVTGPFSAFSADNVLFPSSPYFDYSGLTYTSAGDSYGLYWANASRSRADAGFYAECYASGCNDTINFRDVTDLRVSAVPEPATWALMLLGFAGMGIVGYRRKSVLA
jgi:hypothetical protein